MPIIKKHDNSYDFCVECVETDETYGQTTYVFLKQNLSVVETYGDNGDGEVLRKTEFYPIIEHPEMGLCWWDSEECCWTPEDNEKVKKAYCDYIADQVVLDVPTSPNKKTKGRR